MPPAYDIHPEFGYFCPAPRARRELRVAVVSILAGMAIGAAIMAIHSGQAAETEAVSGNSQLKSSAPDPLAAVPAASLRIKDADNAKAESCGNDQAVSDAVVRVRSSKAPSSLAGIPLGRTAPGASRPPQVRPRPRTQRLRARPRLYCRRHQSRLPSPPFLGPRSGPALCMPDAIGTTRMRTRAGRTGVGPIGASAPMPKIDIGAARIATGCTDESRCRERAVARLAP